MKSILNNIKKEFPDKSIDISECLQLLNEVISSTMDDINEKMNKSFKNRDFEKLAEMTKLAEETTEYEKKIDNIIEILDIEEEIIVEDIFELNDKPDYESYRVDHKVEHTLYENFTHIRPYGFKFSNKEIIETSTWRDMFIKMCELLIEIDENKFMQFRNDPKMNGRKRSHFSRTGDNMRIPHCISDLVYIELNLSSNGIRNTVVKMLKEYKIDPKDVKIYFSHDYNEIHK